MVQFLKEHVLITATVQSRALSGEVGVGVFQSRRKGREGPTWQLGFLNFQVNAENAVIYEVYCIKL